MIATVLTLVLLLSLGLAWRVWVTGRRLTETRQRLTSAEAWMRSMQTRISGTEQRLVMLDAYARLIDTMQEGMLNGDVSVPSGSVDREVLP